MAEREREAEADEYKPGVGEGRATQGGELGCTLAQSSMLLDLLMVDLLISLAEGT